MRNNKTISDYMLFCINYCNGNCWKVLKNIFNFAKCLDCRIIMTIIIEFYILKLGELRMEILNTILLVVLAAELFLILSNLSSLRRELKEHQKN
jgi:hypothetical protein